MTAASCIAGAQRAAARRTPRAPATRSGRVSKPAQAQRRKSRRVSAARALADAGGEAVFSSPLRLNSPGRAARVAASAAVFASVDARRPGRFRRGAVAVDAWAALPSDYALAEASGGVAKPAEAGGPSWRLVPAAKSPRSPSVAALLTSPGGTATRRSASPTRLDEPFVAPLSSPRRSVWATPGGPLARAANDQTRSSQGGGGGGGGGAGGRGAGGRGGGGGGGGRTPTRRGTPPSPQPNRRGGASARGRHLGFAVLAAVGITGAARQATRLRRAPAAGFSLLRSAVTTCATVLHGASRAMPAASVAEAAAPPFMLAPRALPSVSEAAAPLLADGVLAFPRMYEVREGDTLWSIAHTAYGDGGRYADIIAANPGLAETLSEAGSGLDAGASLRLPPP